MKRRIILILIILAIAGGLAGGIYWYARQGRGTKLLARAELAIRAEQFDRAVELAGSYIAKYPEDWRGYYLQARAYNRLGRYTEARTPLENAARLQPTEVAVPLTLAETYALPAKRSLAAEGDSA